MNIVSSWQRLTIKMFWNFACILYIDEWSRNWKSECSCVIWAIWAISITFCALKTDLVPITHYFTYDWCNKQQFTACFIYDMKVCTSLKLCNSKWYVLKFVRPVEIMNWDFVFFFFSFSRGMFPWTTMSWIVSFLHGCLHISIALQLILSRMFICVFGFFIKFKLTDGNFVRTNIRIIFFFISFCFWYLVRAASSNTDNCMLASCSNIIQFFFALKKITFFVVFYALFIWLYSSSRWLKLQAFVIPCIFYVNIFEIGCIHFEYSICSFHVPR